MQLDQFETPTHSSHLNFKANPPHLTTVKLFRGIVTLSSATRDPEPFKTKTQLFDLRMALMYSISTVNNIMFFCFYYVLCIFLLYSLIINRKKLKW